MLCTYIIGCVSWATPWDCLSQRHQRHVSNGLQNSLSTMTPANRNFYLHYNLTEPLLHMQSVVKRNVLQSMTVQAGVPCFIVLCFIALCRCCIYILKVLQQPRVEHICGHCFPNSRCSLCVSVPHFSSQYSISYFFTITISVIRDLSCYYCNCF